MQRNMEMTEQGWLSIPFKNLGFDVVEKLWEKFMQRWKITLNPDVCMNDFKHRLFNLTSVKWQLYLMGTDTPLSQRCDIFL